MPNRILKESICTSETIAILSAFEENFFYRLIVSCDDFGRIDARPAILRSKLYPLKNVTDKQMSDCLQNLREAGILDLYFVDGKAYLQLRTWDKHQQRRAKNSKYPAPEQKSNINSTKEIAGASICNQMYADVPEKRETRNEERESRNEKRETRIENRGTENEERETRKDLSLSLSHEFSEICRLWSKCTTLRVTERVGEELGILLEEYGADNLSDAISISSEQGKVTLAYLKGILRNKAVGSLHKSREEIDGEKGKALIARCLAEEAAAKGGIDNGNKEK